MAEGAAGGRPALEGIRICDFTGQMAGAAATRALGAFGAQVIRIEDPSNEGRWDILRGMGPFIDDRRGIDMGGAFNQTNVEKLGITLNVRTEKGKEILRRLVALSDAVTENFAAGVLARLGFGYEELQAIRPDIVYVSNSGFGATGPYARYRTWGPIVQALSGLTFTSGLPDQPPAGWGYSYMDHQGANFMAVAVLGALLERERSGKGQWVDMACTEAGVALNGPCLLDYTVNGRPMRRPGSPNSNRSTSPAMAPHGIYPCAGEDNWVAVSCRDDDDWAALAKVVGEPWAADPRFGRLAGRLADEDELDRHMAGVGDDAEPPGGGRRGPADRRAGGAGGPSGRAHRRRPLDRGLGPVAGGHPPRDRRGPGGRAARAPVAHRLARGAGRALSGPGQRGGLLRAPGPVDRRARDTAR